MERRKIKKIGTDMRTCFLMLAGTTTIGFWFRSQELMDNNIIMMYMLCVLFVTSMTEGFIYGIITAVFAMMCFNYFFVPPHYSLNVDNPSYMVSMVIMLFAAVITSMITSKSKSNEQKAKAREYETSVMLRLTNQIVEAHSMEEIAESVVKYAGSILNSSMDCLIVKEEGKLLDKFLHQSLEGEQTWAILPDKEEQEQELQYFGYLDYNDKKGYRNWPIYGQEGILAILKIPIKGAMPPSQEKIRLLISMKETAGLAMERLRVRERQVRDSVLIEKERYRSTLLRSISHDLRTPLAGIMGTAGMLLDMMGETDPKSSYLKDINQDAEWLYELVENVLSLTRLRDSGMVCKEPEICEEVIETACRKVRGRLGKRRLQVQVPQECLIVSMDIKLIEQVLVNLLDNAIKYTQEDGIITITVERWRRNAVFEITDNGKGIEEEDLSYIFQLFYTTYGVNSDGKKGTGIGLAICESVVKAHGGRIYAANGEGGGAIFRFTIPIEESSGHKEELKK